MKFPFAALPVLTSFVAAGLVMAAEPSRENVLMPAAAFDGIADRDARAAALFVEAAKVITSPRCMNCHPAGDRPTQGDDEHPHLPLVVRGADDFGAVGMRCGTCHGSGNFDAGHLPGVSGWHLAPLEMAWQGKSLREICEQVKDPKRNGGRTLGDLVHHAAEDEIVGWGWHPGKGRKPAPGTQKQFGALISAWVDAGAACPTAASK